MKIRVYLKRPPVKFTMTMDGALAHELNAACRGRMPRSVLIRRILWKAVQDGIEFDPVPWNRVVNRKP